MARNAKSVGAKLGRMEADYKKAFDFVSNTGQGLMEEGKDITEYVKKLCPFYYVLDPIMASRASTKPLAMFDSADADGEESEDVDDEADEADEPDDPKDSDYELLSDGELADITDEYISDQVLALDEEEAQHHTKEKIKRKKRPLSLMEDSPAPKKKVKIHPAVEILNNLSSAVAEAAD